MADTAQAIYDELIERLRNKPSAPLESFIETFSPGITLTVSFDFEAYEKQNPNHGYSWPLKMEIKEVKYPSIREHFAEWIKMYRGSE